MLTYLEKFLFENFRNLPAWVRVVTYFVMLALFVYLMLVPRFIDGQLVVKDPASGGHVPYRGAQIQMLVDGRPYKFKANEDGFWSIPLVSRIPGELEVTIFHEDIGRWFPVKFSGLQLWRKNAHRIEVTNEAPFFILTADARSMKSGRTFVADLVLTLVDWFAPDAMATLILPDDPDQRLPVAERKSIEQEVITAVSAVTGRDRKQVTGKMPLAGAAAPTYLQKIQIIARLEKQYGFSIPDEHWRPMLTVQEIMDYLEKRQLLNQKHPLLKDTAKSWPTIQQSLPPEQRPVFKR